MNNQGFINTVERNKAASRVCNKLFSELSGTPLHGDIQRITVECWENGGDEKAIEAACRWWLWAKDLAIDNTFSKEAKIQVKKHAAMAASCGLPIHFTSARSPELLHAQVEGQGDKSLPRSTKALEVLKNIQKQSSDFLPTIITILFADLAIDNLDAIRASCDVEVTIQENIKRLEQIAADLGMANIQIIRLSELKHPGGSNLAALIDQSGKPRESVPLNGRAVNLIEAVTKESQDSHSRMFGWTSEQSREHNTNLGITMGLVGQAVQQLVPSPMLIHNESFISRGALNNLFTDPRQPLPVICLRSLLESKKPRK